MKIFKTIRNKLLFVFLTFGLLILLTGGISLYFILQKYLTDQTYFELSIIKEQKTKQVEIFFKDRINEIELISNSFEIKTFIHDFDSKKINLKQIQKELEYLKSSNYYSEVFISNGKEIIIKKVTNTNDEVTFGRIYSSRFETSWIRTSIWGKTVITDYKENSKFKSIIIASPIKDGQLVIGMVGIVVSSARIDEMVYGNNNQSAFGNSGDIFFVGRDYQIRTKNKFFDKNDSNLKFIPQRVIEVFEMNKVDFESVNENGDKIFLSGNRLNVPFLNWALIVTINQDEALGLIERMGKNYFFMLVIFSLGIILLAYYISNRITNPIKQLKNSVTNVEGRELELRVPEYGSNEVIELARAFNKMIKNLKEKTEALKEREMRLFHLYSATNDGIILYENDLPVLVNRAMERLTNFTKEELNKSNISSILNFERKRLNELDGTLTFETQIKRKDESLFNAEVQIRKILYFGKEINACAIRDITKRKEIEDELEKTKEEHLSSIFDEIEKERQRLARELHDGLGQTFIALQLQLQNALSEKNGESKEIILKVIKNMDGAIEEIRNISNDLTPAVLIEFGLSQALNKICSDLNSTYKGKIIYHGEVLENPPNIRTIKYLYRIAQEAINNAIKYSGSGKIEVNLAEENEKIILKVQDNGKGFNSNKIVNGFGLNNMKERTKIIGGKLVITSKENLGTIITVTLNKEKLRSEQN